MAAAKPAKDICRACPVKAACLTYALDLTEAGYDDAGMGISPALQGT